MKVLLFVAPGFWLSGCSLFFVCATWGYNCPWPIGKGKVFPGDEGDEGHEGDEEGHEGHEGAC